MMGRGGEGTASGAATAGGAAGDLLIFPSPEERTAGAALVLLQASSFTRPPPPLSPSLSSYSSSSSSSRSSSRGAFLFISGEISFDGQGSNCKDEDLLSSNSSSCSSFSALISRGQIQANGLRLLAVAARCHGIKRKVVRKARSRILYGSRIKKKKKLRTDDDNNSTVGTKQQKGEEDAAAVSCLSSTISAAGGSGGGSTSSRSGAPSALRPSSTSSRGSGCFYRPLRPRGPRSGESGAPWGCGEEAGAGWMKRRLKERKDDFAVGGGSGSTSTRRRAEAILKLLSVKGSTPEVRIREALGDSPDTSKALRMLVKLGLVTRSGAGGRTNPFLYMVSGLRASTADSA